MQSNSVKRSPACILVISFSDLAADPRVSRQIRFLSPHYRVVAAGLKDPALTGVEFVPLVSQSSTVGKRLRGALLLLGRQYQRYYWGGEAVSGAIRELSALRPDLVLANEIESLPLALQVAKGAKVLFDAHEYAPLEFEDLWRWRLLYQPYKRYLCHRYIPRVDAMTTVGPAIADRYHADTGIRPRVLTNAPEYEVLEPSALEPGRIRLVHHGAAIRSRRIEAIIDAMEYLDQRFELDLLLVPGSPGYLEELRRAAGSDGRIHFREPVPLSHLTRTLNQFDIGVCYIEPTNFNYRYALPNKFFEFIQARLAIAIGPSPEMARLVREHDLGVVAPEFSARSLASSLSSLKSERVHYHKLRSHRIARRLSADPNRELLLELVGRLLR